MLITLKSLAAKTGGISVAAAFAIYTLLRASYGSFYGAFGIAPEDVGLDYPAVMFQSVVGVVVFALLIGFVVMAWTLAEVVTTYLRTRYARRRHKSGKRARVVRLPPIRHFWVGATLIVTLFLLVDELPRQAVGFANRAKEGRPVTWAGFRIDSIVSEKFPILAYRAEPAEVSFTRGSSSKTSGISARETLMYLGTGAENHVLFDYETEEVFRLPIRDAIVVTRDVGRNDPYKFPTWIFFALTGLFVIYLLIIEASQDLKAERATARRLGVEDKA
ncbi:MAG TPA: hypothetical protein VHI71_04545 [Actinomycetota bacterium]|nr:hypothetical protein [Actinomycetota bacterium]